MIPLYSMFCMQTKWIQKTKGEKLILLQLVFNISML